MSGLARMCLGGVALMLAAGLFVACGDKAEDAAPSGTRDPSPLVRIKLKNTSPARPATAQAQPTQNGAPKAPLSVGPVSPGQELASSPNGTDACNGVSLTVNFMGEGSPVMLQGNGTYAGKSIMTVNIEARETGGTATVNFAPGQGTATIELAP